MSFTIQWHMSLDFFPVTCVLHLPLGTIIVSFTIYKEGKIKYLGKHNDWPWHLKDEFQKLSRKWIYQLFLVSYRKQPYQIITLAKKKKKVKAKPNKATTTQKMKANPCMLLWIAYHSVGQLSPRIMWFCYAQENLPLRAWD